MLLDKIVAWALHLHHCMSGAKKNCPSREEEKKKKFIGRKKSKVCPFLKGASIILLKMAYTDMDF